MDFTTTERQKERRQKKYKTVEAKVNAKQNINQLQVWVKHDVKTSKRYSQLNKYKSSRMQKGSPQH